MGVKGFLGGDTGESSGKWRGEGAWGGGECCLREAWRTLRRYNLL